MCIKLKARQPENKNPNPNLSLYIRLGQELKLIWVSVHVLWRLKELMWKVFKLVKAT